MFTLAFPRALTISAGATGIWRQFYDHIEGQCGAGNELEGVGDFAAKAAEHAARIAGVITLVEDLHAREVGLAAMEGGVELANWYVGGANRLKNAVTHGPKALRIKAAAEEALAILVAHGWTIEVSQRPRIIKTVGEVSR